MKYRDYQMSGDSVKVVVHYFEGVDPTGAAIPVGIKVYRTHEYNAMRAETTCWMEGRDLHFCEIDDGTSCEECCEHGDIDDFNCLDCGKDMGEDLFAEAYDRAKAMRQDEGT